MAIRARNALGCASARARASGGCIGAEVVTGARVEVGDDSVVSSTVHIKPTSTGLCKKTSADENVHDNEGSVVLQILQQQPETA